MTIHAFQIYTTDNLPGTESELQRFVDEWVNSQPIWENHGGYNPKVTKNNTEMDGSGLDYYNCSARFEKQNSATEVLQLVAETLNYHGVEWYRLYYHECDHDGGEGGCEWNEMWEHTHSNVSIPEEIKNRMPNKSVDKEV